MFKLLALAIVIALAALSLSGHRGVERGGASEADDHVIVMYRTTERGR